MSGDILIYVEHESGRPRRISLECASKAADVAQGLGGSVHAIVLGAGATSTASMLGEYGVDVVHASDDAAYDTHGIEPAVGAAASLIESLQPAAMILPYSQDGRDVAGRLAARLNRAVVANVVDIQASEGKLAATETVFGGSFTTTVTGGDNLTLLMARPNAFKAEQKNKSGSLEAISYSLTETDRRVTRAEIVQEEGA